MIATLLSAALTIPPPPDWQPPRFEGPVLMCGSTYGLSLVAGENATLSWPGEVFINDVFSTFTVATPRGAVVVTENGPTTRPSGAGRRDGRVGTRFIMNHGGGVYSVQVATAGNIRAVTLRFPATFAAADRRALLTRLRAAPSAAQCGRPVSGSIGA
ncbi:MAG TPA: hypothetical protein VMG08_12460 [Allosphingosinicella sp.]|nr:hypothetical protein [Allosphingosinicella sp.]